MSEFTLTKKGVCTCGCVEEAVYETSDGRRFYQKGGLGYVEYDEKADYGLRIWDECLPGFGLNNEVPVDEAILRSYQYGLMRDDPIPDDVFEDAVERLHVPFMS